MKPPKKLLTWPANFADSGIMLFMREIATNPTAMGAACPSSKILAKHIAMQIPKTSGLIVELGGGTGVITEAILQQEINPEQLIVIERSPSLAQHLQERFPKLNIIQDDACHLAKLLAIQSLPIHTIVSGLPLRSLPTAVVQTIGAQLESILEDGALYIQFTYSLHRPPLPPSARLCCVHSQYVWWNFPPARIDVFRYAG